MMEETVIGIDLGTGSVKTVLVNNEGAVLATASQVYPLIQEKSGYSEQNPEDWLQATKTALKMVIDKAGIHPDAVKGMSFSGQMHGLVLLNKHHQILRPAILWNDTRTKTQCQLIKEKAGERVLGNPVLDGFTLPKILWVQENEPEIWDQTAIFLLPKDYIRFRLTGELGIDYSDAAGTLLLNQQLGDWDDNICKMFKINPDICPKLVYSHEQTGSILPQVADEIGLSSGTKVFAGGADNACGAVGAGVLKEGDALCSIGTSGVILTVDQNSNTEYGHNLHYFHHADKSTFYAMGVTLGAGYSLNWYKNTFSADIKFEDLLDEGNESPTGANGLLFTPYLAGERTPHGDSSIRGSFIGIDGRHTRSDFTKAVLEGITFSLNESVELLKEAGHHFTRMISIGGGAKSNHWLQMQADIFQVPITTLKHEEGPGFGAAMIAAFGLGWFESLSACAKKFIQFNKTYYPRVEHSKHYQQQFKIYKQVYSQTREMTKNLLDLNNSKVES